VSTNITVVPCSENFETQAPPRITLQFLVTNEFEQTLSASTSFTCWASFDLEQINFPQSPFLASSIGGAVLRTTMRVVGGRTGVIPVIEETHNDTVNGLTARAAQNAHSGFQDVIGPDLVVIPGEQLQIPEP